MTEVEDYIDFNKVVLDEVVSDLVEVLETNRPSRDVRWVNDAVAKMANEAVTQYGAIEGWKADTTLHNEKVILQETNGRETIDVGSYAGPSLRKEKFDNPDALSEDEKFDRAKGFLVSAVVEVTERLIKTSEPEY